MFDQRFKTRRELLFALIILAVIPAIVFAGNKLFNETPDGSYDNSKHIAYFNGKEYLVPPEIVTPKYLTDVLTMGEEEEEKETDVLGSEKKEKRIEINLTEQKLYALEGDKQKMEFDVSTGKWAETPTGEYRIWIKLKYTLMTGGSKDDNSYYYLPNVPYTMYFHQGYGIHGAYWHDNFGHPMSHGCVNMRIEDAEKLFYWANPSLPEGVNSILSSDENKGTRIIIYGETPRE